MSIMQVSGNRLSEAVNTPGVVLVDFTASWCPPCKALNPILDELSQLYEGRATIVKLDVDEDAGAAERYGIMSMPTVIAFHNGVPVDKLVGLRPRQAYQQIIERYA